MKQIFLVSLFAMFFFAQSSAQITEREGPCRAALNELVDVRVTITHPNQKPIVLNGQISVSN